MFLREPGGVITILNAGEEIIFSESVGGDNEAEDQSEAPIENREDNKNTHPVEDVGQKLIENIIKQRLNFLRIEGVFCQ